MHVILRASTSCARTEVSVGIGTVSSSRGSTCTHATCMRVRAAHAHARPCTCAHAHMHARAGVHTHYTSNHNTPFTRVRPAHSGPMSLMVHVSCRNSPDKCRCRIRLTRHGGPRTLLLCWWQGKGEAGLRAGVGGATSPESSSAWSCLGWQRNARHLQGWSPRMSTVRAVRALEG